MAQTPRELTTILVKDKRGTSVQLSLFLAPQNLQDYIFQLIDVWDREYGGEADEVFFKTGTGLGTGMAQWIPPEKPADRKPHGT